MSRRAARAISDLSYEAGLAEIAAAKRSIADVRSLVDEMVDDLEIVLGDAPALCRPVAANRKLSPVDMVDVGMARKRPVPRRPHCAATYLPIEQTCPTTCTFKGHGCMAQSGYTGRAVRRLEEVAKGLSAERIVLAEAREIVRAARAGVRPDGGRDGNGPRDMRLHVSGDVASVRGLRALARAVDVWRRRGGGSVWTFTHAWASLPRAAWGAISVLASVETVDDAARARSLGYVPAMTVRTFPSKRSFSAGGVTWLPCPAETSGEERRLNPDARQITCVECRLCLDRTGWMAANARGIAFAVHGMQAEAAKRQLPVLSATM